MNKKKRNRIMFLSILLLGVTIGFAALATTLKINGSASITKNTWSVYWDEDSIAVTQGSKGDTIPDVVNGEDGSVNTKVNWNVNLELPGDFYEFTIDAVNAGTIDAMITGITPTLPQDLPSYISYSVTYADGVKPAQYHLLPKGTKSGSTITPTTEKYKVRIEFKDTITSEEMNQIPEEGLSLNFGYEVQYGQADDNAYQKASTFQNDSWDVIATNVKKDKSVYPIGATKTIQMDMDGDNIKETYTLRVANNTTPVECSQESFSQTACGFVVEFADVITKYRMNKRDSSGGNGYENHGGWEYSDMRAYLNNGIYLKSTADEIDYTNSGFLNKLPSSLRSKIINTKVVSGRGSYDIDRDNFDTVDLIYLLATHEVWEDTDTAAHDGIHYYDTGYNNTRQLDYYKEQNVTISNYAGAIKNYKDTPTDWWLRSTGTDSPYGYFLVMPQGNIFYYGYCPSTEGVSPAFRLAE